ncbi:ParB/Srx family N-terminal domain-containing protein [Burkholderia gladioli]|uniref:ParB/Srx family N-terminal domain-containing protein n=1 Tax=Burkholderia gladioli TaxID=28095 RepID=UPI003C79CE2E
MNAVITEIPALAHDAGVPPAPPEAHQQADDFRLIPLKRIVASPFNVRRKQPTGIEALADNIWHTGGLLQNLVVHPMKVGAKRAQTFGVAAGERRRRALALLAERGDLPADYPVRCLVITAEDAVLFSATENEMREPMHPADQFDAYPCRVRHGQACADHRPHEGGPVFRPHGCSGARLVRRTGRRNAARHVCGRTHAA